MITIARMTVAGVGALASVAGLAMGAPPQYTIVDLGVIDPGDFGSQGFGVSPNGIAVGRSIGVSNQAFMWTLDDSQVALPNLDGRPFGVANDANASGMVVGTGATTSFGSNPLPLVWQDGEVSQLPLPVGEQFGRAYGVNGDGVTVGSIGSGSGEFGVIYSGDGATVITTTTKDGSFIRSAFGISNDGLVVGFGIDPDNAARNVGFLYDMTTDTATEVGALPGLNGAIAFGVSDAGHVVGSSMQNQGSGTPFIWTQDDGIQAIALPAGTSQGSARGVNSQGWAVGTASSAFAIPFLYDGEETYRLADLLADADGWDLSTNTSSSAMGISEDGVIVGTGELDGEVRACAMFPAASCPADCNADGALNILDFVCFQNEWNAQSEIGDCDANGVYNILDFVCFQGVFAAGCE
jgi:uncharacterized membrane protein